MTFGNHPLEADMPINCLPDQVAEFVTPCHWSAPNICSAPECIEKAYAEAVSFADLLTIYRHGYTKGHGAGYDRGYLAGRKDADNWWLEVEKETDKARQKIWREEPS